MKTLKNTFFILLFGSVLCISNCAKTEANKRNPNFNADELILIHNGKADESMNIMNYFIYEDSIILRKQSSNILDFEDPSLDLLIDRMYTTVRNPAHPGVGIAAPQIGINKKIIWVQRYDKTGFPFEVYINPEISAYSDTLVARNDGCLSIPGVSQKSMRAIWVDIDYYKSDGSFHSERITNQYTAHIFQHEIDHLEGIVFLDRPE
jgi:peptide deformylase